MEGDKGEGGIKNESWVRGLNNGVDGGIFSIEKEERIIKIWFWYIYMEMPLSHYIETGISFFSDCAVPETGQALGLVIIIALQATCLSVFQSYVVNASSCLYLSCFATKINTHTHTHTHTCKPF